MKIFEKREIFVGDQLYLTRYGSSLFKGYHLHVFHRGDPDPDPHDHPWAFDTFPLVSYTEMVWDNGAMRRRPVAAGYWHHRDATYTHRVLESLWLPQCGTRNVVSAWNVVRPRSTLPWYTRLSWWLFGDGKIVTIVKLGKEERKWGFQRAMRKDGNTFWVWLPWREYKAKLTSWMED